MNESDFQLSSYNYDLPEERIAQYPPEKRGASRLMVLDRASGKNIHSTFSHLGDFLPEGALLVANNSCVVPARLFGASSHGRQGGTSAAHAASAAQGLRLAWSRRLESRAGRGALAPLPQHSRGRPPRVRRRHRRRSAQEKGIRSARRDAVLEGRSCGMHAAHRQAAAAAVHQARAEQRGHGPLSDRVRR